MPEKVIRLTKDQIQKIHNEFATSQRVDLSDPEVVKKILQKHDKALRPYFESLNRIRRNSVANARTYVFF